MVRLEPRVEGVGYAAQGQTTEAEGGAGGLEQTMRLVREFGSQRRQRQLAASQAAKVDARQTSAGGAVLGIIARAGAAATMSKVGWCVCVGGGGGGGGGFGGGGGGWGGGVWR